MCMRVVINQSCFCMCCAIIKSFLCKRWCTIIFSVIILAASCSISHRHGIRKFRPQYNNHYTPNQFIFLLFLSFCPGLLILQILYWYWQYCQYCFQYCRSSAILFLNKYWYWYWQFYYKYW